MPHFVYIIYSEKLDRYYVGETPNVEIRLAFHNDLSKNDNSTRTGIPWELFWSFEVADRGMARKIEAHIKKMKSRKYYHSLKNFPEMSKGLLEKFKAPGSHR